MFKLNERLFTVYMFCTVYIKSARIPTRMSMIMRVLTDNEILPGSLYCGAKMPYSCSFTLPRGRKRKKMVI